MQTVDDHRELANRVHDRGASDACPACETGRLEPAPDILALPLSRAEKHLPVLALVCPQCGYVRTHMIGVLEPQAEPE
jgi:hypothetical protein